MQDDKGATALDSQLQTEPDKARLSQKVFANKANDYGNKSDSYVAAHGARGQPVSHRPVADGLGRGRYFLALPGVAIALVCVGWAVIITTGSITQVSPNAIDLTAQGQQLQSNGDAKGAIDKYHAAIADSPQFGAAFARLSNAEFQAGAPSSGANQFQSLSDPAATKRAIDSGEKAISLGEGNASLLSSVGFFHFAAGEYDRAEVLSQQALDANDQFPPLVFNLGVVQVAKGEASAAEATYRRGIDLLNQEQDTGLRQEIISAARTDLEVAVTATPDSKDLVQKMKDLLAEAEVPIIGAAGQPPAKASNGSSVTDVNITTDRFRLLATYNTDGFDPTTQLLNVWYFRPLDANGNGPFEQIFPLDRVTFTGTNPVATPPVENGACLPGGDYRVEVYAGPDLVATADQHVPDSPLGTLIVDGGEDVGFTMCHPDSWTPPPVTFQPGSLAFANPKDSSQFVLVFSFPIGAGSGVNGTALLNATIQTTLQQQQITVDGPPAAGEELLGRTVDGTDVTLATTTVTGTNALGKVRITGSVGTDDVVRVVIISAANSQDLDLVRGELVNSIRFLRVPPTASSNGG